MPSSSSSSQHSLPQVHVLASASHQASAAQRVQTSSPFNGTKFLKISQVSKYLSVSERTVRQMCDSGELPCFKTAGDHRRIDALKLYEYAHGLTPDEAAFNAERKEERLLIGLARVSSRKQASPNGSNESSLKHQEDRIRKYSREKYGHDIDEMILSVGSGLNFERKEFLELIQRIVTKQLMNAIIILTCPDRLCRFGRKLVEYLCSIGNVTLDYMSEEDDKGDSDSLVDDVLAVMTHFTAKNSGRKAGDILRVVMTPEHFKRAYALKQRGMSYKAIAEHFDKRRIKSEKGQKYSAAIIRRHLVANWGLLSLSFASQN